MTNSLPHAIPVGISGCLLGEKVRYDASHKRSSYCQDVLSRYFEFRPICPEMAIGLGTPRPTIRLIASDSTRDPAHDHDSNGGDNSNGIRAIQSTASPRDVTRPLADYADTVLQTHTDLCGFVLTEKSPSCGLFRVKTWNEQGQLQHDRGRGIFARRLTERMPHLPVEEAGRLNDAHLCENFILRVYAWHEWHTCLLPALDARNLLAFWSRYKYLTLAHNEPLYRQIGPLLANVGKADLPVLANTFFDTLMSALETPSTRGSNTNALQHLQGYLKKSLDAVEKKSLQQLIRQYKEGIVPMIVPLSMMRHLFNRYPDSYIHQQKFLQPYPDELGLHNRK